MVALEQLGFGPCYHMRDLLMDLDGQLPHWQAVADGRQDWEEIFGEARSTLDWPSARYWRELAEHYPEAKVVLSVRDPKRWIASMRETVWAMYFGDSVTHHLCEARAQVDPAWNGFLGLMRRITWNPGTGVFGDDPESDEGLEAGMQAWHESVKQGLPEERLLVWDPADGWDPLCRFLEVPVPSEPLPRVNDTTSFKEGMIGGALEVLNTWWDARERPETGLHGAALH